ncbi:ETX/MTX2 family pore-forming toxin [Carnobacterium maltaromaticum]|uniref:ETX/MTX2 family pore-forming toxin n=1 Tax=Carnobacterium maltaromaticum TaxID=2751 RepID=UPI0018CE9384|nr:ETX/MTX2 family pore-forming toxin [Carnobacterium maltaromaticum]
MGNSIKKNFFTILLRVACFLSIFILGNSFMSAQAANITDVDTQMDKISDFYFKNEFEGKDLPDKPGAYHYLLLESKKTDMDLNLNASDLKNLSYSDTTPEYVGENEFDNRNGEKQQTFTTASYSHQVTNTVSTAVTQGFKVGGKTTLFNKSVLLPDGVDIVAEFNSQTSETKTKTDTKTLTASPQNITVPAGKIYQVKVDMAKKTFNGDIDFSAVGTNVMSSLYMRATYYGPGFPRPTLYPSLSFGTADIYERLSFEQKNQVKGLNFDTNKNLQLYGKARVNGIVGSKLRVSVYDITESKVTPKLVQQKSIN